MAKYLDPSQPVRFEPAGETLKPEGRRIAYLFRAPTLADRRRFRRALVIAGGVRHSEAAISAEFRRGLDRLLAAGSAEHAAATALLDEYESRRDGFYAQLRAGAFGETEEGRTAFAQGLAAVQESDKALAVLAVAVRETWPAYAQKLADNATYAEAAGLAALQLLATGWENIGADFARVPAPGGALEIPDAALLQVPEYHLGQIAAFVETLFAPTEAEIKN